MTNERADELAKRVWGSSGAVLAVPRLGARHAFTVGAPGKGSGSGCCWEEAFLDAAVDPIDIAGVPHVDEDPHPGRQKTQLGKALEVLAEAIGVTPGALRRRIQRRARPASP